MKKLFLLVALNCSALFYAQDDQQLTKLLVSTIFYQNDNLYKSVDYILDKSDLMISEKNGFYVTDIVRKESKIYLAGYFYGEPSYIELTDPNRKFIINNGEQRDKEDSLSTFDDVELFFKNLSEDKKKTLVNNAKRVSIIMLSGVLTESESKVAKYKNYPILISKANPTEDYYMTGAQFEIINMSKKTIKYISFNFYGKNPVGDKVLYRKGVVNASRKGIGPVKQFDTVSWSFDSVWLTDVVETLELTSVNIQYMDGTTKAVKITDNMWFDESLYEENKFLNEQFDKFYELIQ